MNKQDKELLVIADIELRFALGWEGCDWGSVGSVYSAAQAAAAKIRELERELKELKLAQLPA